MYQEFLKLNAGIQIVDLQNSGKTLLPFKLKIVVQNSFTWYAIKSNHQKI